MISFIVPFPHIADKFIVNTVEKAYFFGNITCPGVDKPVDYVDVILKKMTERMREIAFFLLHNDK